MSRLLSAGRTAPHVRIGADGRLPAPTARMLSVATSRLTRAASLAFPDGSVPELRTG